MPVKHVELNVSDGAHLTIGDVVQCSANTDYPPVSYYWQQHLNESWQQLKRQDDDNVDDNNGTTLTLSKASVYITLRCVARNIIGNVTFTAVSNSITLYVAEPGLCFKNVNIEHYSIYLPRMLNAL